MKRFHFAGGKRWSIAASVALLALLLAASDARAQAGNRDSTYHATQFNNSVMAIHFDPTSGKVVVTGDFTSYYEPVPVNAYTTAPGVARVNADGSPDKTFSAGPAFSGLSTVYGSDVQADGKVVVGGDFTEMDGSGTHRNLARLNSDGTGDAAANPNLGSGPDGTVRAVAVQPDGRILVGGEFRTFNGAPSAGFVRLNTDLSLDGSFVPDTTQPVSYRATKIIVQPDGKILFLAGINSPPVRLTASGSVDASFDTKGVMAATGGGDILSLGSALALQDDGKVLAAVDYATTTDGGSTYTFSDSIVRLNTDGTLDPSFDFSAKIVARDPSSVPALRVILVQPDGAVLFGGDDGGFVSVGGNSAHGLARLTPGGLFDGSFAAPDIGDSTRAGVKALALQGDGRLLVGSQARFPLDRLNDLNGGGTHPAFFSGEANLGSGAYYLQFPRGNPFGYYSYLADPNYIFHFDLGYEYVFDAGDGNSGVYFYDFTSSSFFYSSPGFPFPYLYDFSLNTVLYYYPNPSDPTHYNTDGVRYFYRFDTGEIFSK